MAQTRKVTKQELATLWFHEFRLPLLIIILVIEIFSVKAISQIKRLSIKTASPKEKALLFGLLAIFNLTLILVFFDIPYLRLKYYLLAVFFMPSLLMLLAFLYAIYVWQFKPRLKLDNFRLSESAKGSLAKLELSGIALLLGAALWGTFVTTDNIEATHETLYFDRLPKELDGLVIAHLSDIHFGESLGEKELENVINITMRQKPDLIAITGDFLDASIGRIPNMTALLRRLRAPLGVYAVLGNHDFYLDPDKIGASLRRAGIVLLQNGSASLPFHEAKIRLNIVGVDDYWGSIYGEEGANLDKAFYGLDRKDFTIFLSHQPILFDKTDRFSFDLMLSGHTHGGQVGLWGEWGKIISLGRLSSPYVFGVYKKDGRILYVTRGIGTTGLPLRLGISPEIAILTLRAKKSKVSPANP
ncbi:MAG: hypothetical protein Kow0090_15170 [Myxococcota bacterium]